MKKDEIKKIKTLNNHEEFMLQSNKIEGECRINPDDIDAIICALEGIHTLNDIMRLHLILGSYLKADWVGHFRACEVTIGGYRPPSHKYVPSLMQNFVADLPTMNSWEAHNEFERIHPFQDLNGRVGRLVWLNKAVNEGYSFKIPFLQAYYYQTLAHYEKNS